MADKGTGTAPNAPDDKRYGRAQPYGKQAVQQGPAAVQGIGHAAGTEPLDKAVQSVGQVTEAGNPGKSHQHGPAIYEYFAQTEKYKANHGVPPLSNRRYSLSISKIQMYA